MNRSEKSKTRPPQWERYAWGLAAVWTVVVVASLLWNVIQVRRNTLEAARIQARVAHGKDVLYRRWNAGHTGVYVPVAEATKPNLYLFDIPERDITTPSGAWLTLMNPAYMTRQVHELAEQESGVRGHITSLQPIRPENAPDPWETKALQAFERGATEVSETQTMEGEEYMRLMRPLITEKGCLTCHATQGYQEGDIRGGISVSIPMEPQWTVARGQTLPLTGGHTMLWLIGLGGITWGTRRLRRSERERQQAEEALREAKDAAEQANQAKSIFLTNMSHELRTPLNSILGYAQILALDPSTTAKQRRGLNVIEQSGGHLLALINDVLDLAKVESGKVELHETNFHLPAFLRGIGEIFCVRAERKGLSFRLELPPSSPPAGALASRSGGGLSGTPPTGRCPMGGEVRQELPSEGMVRERLPIGVRGDERRLRQILINLLGNAVKFTDEGGITLRVMRKAKDGKQKIRFEVEDTGIGISPQDLEQIFDPFQQASDWRRRPKGTGLGLTISRNLVELMGGALNVRSQVGSGSTFWFDIALIEVEYGVNETVQAERQIIGVKGKAPRILVVDDNQENRAVLVDLLSPLDFEIVEASNGREGLVRARELRPAAIITDLFMPEIDGFELIRQIRQSPLLESTVVIATSASVYEKDQQKSLTVDSNAFLPKPVDASLLFEQLEQFLALEWLYQEPLDETATKDSAEFIPPPVEIVETLLDLTMTGDVEELEEYLVKLAWADERYKPFATRLQQLAREFKLNRIRDLLKEYLE